MGLDRTEEMLRDGVEELERIRKVRDGITGWAQKLKSTGEGPTRDPKDINSIIDWYLEDRTKQLEADIVSSVRGALSYSDAPLYD